MINVRVKEVVRYGGHSLSANGSVNFTLKAGYSELPNSIKLMQLLNNDVYIKAKIPGEKPMKLGDFRVKQIVIDGDGESVLKFNGLNDYIEMDNLNLLPMNDSDIKEFVVMMEADIEDEENDESEDEDDGEE
ncbi:MAG: hypothetical protein PHN69_05355 [Candidatus Pacebacteria bacterium]|nr:hypothetical protein [Candidatus Paceibacterota bacterium]